MARRALQDHLPKAVRPLSAVRDLLQKLLTQGTRLAVGSSAKKDELDVYLKIAGIADLLEVTVSSEDVERSKPDSDVFEAALHKLGVVIGDSRTTLRRQSEPACARSACFRGRFPESTQRRRLHSRLSRAYRAACNVRRVTAQGLRLAVRGTVPSTGTRVLGARMVPAFVPSRGHQLAHR